MQNDNKIVKLTAAASAAAAGREAYEAPMVTIIALDVDDIIMESTGETPFVPNSLDSGCSYDSF